MNDRPFCASSPEAQLLSDEDFWAAVFPQPDERDEPDPDDCPDMVIGQCIRCQGGIRVESYEEAVERQDEALCDDCADELLPDEDALYPEVSGH
jgi:hypothetical protein